jgi:hypothetical protein
LRRSGWRTVTIWTCELVPKTERLIADLQRRTLRRTRNSRGSRHKTRRA